VPDRADEEVGGLRLITTSPRPEVEETISCALQAEVYRDKSSSLLLVGQLVLLPSLIARRSRLHPRGGEGGMQVGKFSNTV